MKFLKYILIVFTIIGIIVCFYIHFPIPSFEPEKEILKKIEDKNIIIEWNKRIGILDQNFPDYIIIQKGKVIDTVCNAYNIANIETYNEELRIGFYGTPEYFHQNFVIREEIFGYKIIIDSGFLMEEDKIPIWRKPIKQRENDEEVF